MLEGTNRGGYDRDWSPVSIVHAVSIRDDQEAPSSSTRGLATGPAGTRCAIVAFVGGQVRRLNLGSGTWVLSTTTDGLDATRLDGE